MDGDLLGPDGIGSNRHTCDAVALTDLQVCVIHYEQLEERSRKFGDLQRQCHRIMSRKIVREHDVMLLLGSMRVEQRRAAFLLKLTQRLRSRGCSPSSLLPRMTRQEIGTYLGLKLETVSCCFSKLQEDGTAPARQAAADPGSGSGRVAGDRRRHRLLNRLLNRPLNLQRPRIRGSPAAGRLDHMWSIITCPNPEQLTCVAPSISRAKS
jgi:hypothetical protein